MVAPVVSHDRAQLPSLTATLQLPGPLLQSCVRPSRALSLLSTFCWSGEGAACLGPTADKGGIVQDVLLYYGAKEYGSGPRALGNRSPRESYNIESENFIRERGSYQNPPEHP